MSASGHCGDETHTLHKREPGKGDAYIITAQLLAYDDIRVHSFLPMYDERPGFLAATIEWLGLYVSLGDRRQISLRKPAYSDLGDMK